MTMGRCNIERREAATAMMAKTEAVAPGEAAICEMLEWRDRASNGSRVL
jgi:hypothetical protein